MKQQNQLPGVKASEYQVVVVRKENIFMGPSSEKSTFT
jgi:hypothetical protein